MRNSIERIGKAFIPERIRPTFRKYLLKAGFVGVPYNFFGKLFYGVCALTFFLFVFLVFPFIREHYGKSTVMLSFFSFFAAVFIFFALYCISLSLLFFYYDMRIYNRTKEMESLLDEFLQFISQNLKGGMAFDRALYACVRPQFSALANEVLIAAKKAITGKDISVALDELADKYDSQLMRRSFNLITESTRGGGELAEIIDRIVENLRQTKKLKEEMNAAVLNYVIFISVIVIIIAPGLFAVSTQLLSILKKFAGELAKTLTGTPGALQIQFQQISLSDKDFLIFCYTALGVISVCSSMILSIIRTGNVKSGLKYIPIFLASTLIMFTIFVLILRNVMALFQL